MSQPCQTQNKLGLVWFLGKTLEDQRNQFPIGFFTVAMFGIKEETQTIKEETQTIRKIKGKVCVLEVRPSDLMGRKVIKHTVLEKRKNKVRPHGNISCGSAYSLLMPSYLHAQPYGLVQVMSFFWNCYMLHCKEVIS